MAKGMPQVISPAGSTAVRNSRFSPRPPPARGGPGGGGRRNGGCGWWRSSGLLLSFAGGAGRRSSSSHLAGGGSVGPRGAGWPGRGGRRRAAGTVRDMPEAEGVSVMAQPTRSEVPEPVRDGLGATIMGPRNVELERQNPNLLASPDTDAGTIPNLKFSFSDARNRLLSGGWSREVTARELPAATTLAGVNMRLKPGAIPELHWHKEADWADVLSRHTAIPAI